MRLRQSLRERLAAHRPLVGLMQTQPSPILSELAGICGYDFLMLDCEHGWFSDMDLDRALITAHSTGLTTVIRLRAHNAQDVGRYVDMGVDGIMVPNVSTVEQATMLAQAMDYPPGGTRAGGAGLHRVSHYGANVAAYMKSPRENALLIVMIESALGVANVEKIVAVNGVDALFVGPSDLSSNLGYPKDYSQPTYAEALERIERAASAQGKVIGTAPHPGYPIESLVARGHNMFVIGSDMPLIRDAMVSQVASAKSHL